jgi:thiol-disulfide isomerase/thioredoxin
VLTGLVVAAVAVLAATAFGLYRRARDGRLRAASGAAGAGDVLAELGVTPGGPVTLLQFSSEYCAPCRATARLCADVAGATGGVRHVEVDAGAHLDAARALDVTRTPTLLVVDPAGRIVRRAVGRPPARADLLDAVGAAAGTGSRP